jgi:hypothetical protein
MHRILMLLTVASFFVLAVSGCSSDSTSTVSPPSEDLTPPAAPVNLSVSCEDGEVTVAWRENSEIDFASYQIYRGLAGGDYAFVSSADNARFVDQIDDAGLFEFFYRVSAVDDSGNESAYSASASVVFDSRLPDIEEVH